VQKVVETADLEKEYKKHVQSLEWLAKSENGPQLAVYQDGLYCIAW
jgi:hypothetical protein